MKVNLILQENHYRSGYLNILPKRVNCPPREGLTYCDYSNLNPVIDHNEATQFVALEIIDYFSANKVNEVLTHWESKISHQGTLTLSFIDVYEVAKGLSNRSISIEDANNLLHNGRQSCLSIDIVSQLLTEKGMGILSKKVQNFQGIITAQRP